MGRTSTNRPTHCAACCTCSSNNTQPTDWGRMFHLSFFNVRSALTAQGSCSSRRLCTRHCWDGLPTRLQSTALSHTQSTGEPCHVTSHMSQLLDGQSLAQTVLKPADAACPMEHNCRSSTALHEMLLIVTSASVLQLTRVTSGSISEAMLLLRLQAAYVCDVGD